MADTDAFKREPRTPLLLQTEVADLLRIDVRTVRRLAERGELAEVRIGPRLVRYSPESVAAFIAAENFAAEPPSPRQGR
jgi:excisionase family DNA binding protein